MCGGKADERPPPASIPVELPPRRPAAQANTPRPPSARPKADRPTTKHHRPSTRDQSATTHRRERAQTSAGPSKAPQSAHKHRPGTSTSKPNPRTAGGERHRSSQHHKERQKSKFTGNEEIIEDNAIIELVRQIAAFIEQHAHTFYPIDNNGWKENGAELNDPRTRHAAIRRYIAHIIIDSIVFDTETRPDLELIANNICNYLDVYTSDKKVVAHLFQICELADDLREAIDSHPDTWRFESWDRFGYIVMLPELRRNGQAVLGSQRVKNI
ncbi:uncharacterized protein PAC_14439 [Phialocephala subalpina]|uniref:Uncharacterized protein n=1 Tax=Phialocephala subalpina TaxID=576137 RepID=A0A1L7XHP3_9HELO|nr:uncharacterized protein PAC_14439 [Phialocephala subalpina]